MGFHPSIDTVNALVTLDDVKAFLGVSSKEATKEITTITCEADGAGSLNNTYWLLYSVATDYYVWYDVNLAGVDPAITGKTGIKVSIATDATAAQVATATAAAINALSDFLAGAVAAVVTVTNAATGDVDDAIDGDTGWTNAWVTTQQGVDIKYTLNFYINNASWFCNNYTHRLLLSRSSTEYYSGDGTNSLLVNNYPITAITHIYNDLARVYGAGTEITLTDLVFLPQDLAYKIVYDGGVFTKGIKNLKVEYTAGYATIPWDLQEAALELCAFYWDNFENKLFGKVAMSMADGSIRLATTGIPKSVLTVLEHYRKKW